MNQELHDLASWAITTAKKAGADHCRVNLNSDRKVEVSYRQKKPENIKEAKRRSLGLEIYAKGRYSSQSTSDLRPAAMKEFIAGAVATTKMLAEDPYRSLPDPKYYKGRAKVDLEQVDAAYAKYSPEQRHEMARAMEDACLEKGGEKTISVTASVSDTAAESVVLSSNGFSGHSEYTYYSAGASLSAQGEGDRRPSSGSYYGCLHRGDLPEAEAIGAEGAQRTLDLIGGRKIKTEKLPVIVENRVVSRVLWGFLGAMYGSAIQQKQSFLADQKGKKVGSELFTLIDDPLLVGAPGSQLFDGDGITATKRTMVDKGVLKEFWVDWYYSRKLGWEPTSGGPSNLIIPPGTRSVDAIMKDLGRGILITGFIGGNSNPTTGDTSVGILGQLFDEGKRVHAVAEMNIADNYLELWKRLAEVGNDPWIYSSFRTPSLVFTDVVVAGA